MCQNFFIHSSVDGHLGSFHVLAVVNSAAMNNGMHVSFSVLLSSGYMRWMNLELIIESEVSQKDKYRILTHRI